jgi:hypothetical protein
MVIGAARASGDDGSSRVMFGKSSAFARRSSPATRAAALASDLTVMQMPG